MAISYELESRIARLAVQRTVLVTKKVLEAIDKGALSKEDRSPVTLADFAGQALLIAAIHSAFPDDLIVAEEAADTLRRDKKMMEQVWLLASSTHLENEESEKLLYSPASPEEMLDLIDLGGKSNGSPKGRVWMIDPVDGTIAFMKGSQYAVCAVLVVDAEEKVAAIGCPHVSLELEKVSDSEVDRDGSGYLVSAVKGHGAWLQPLSKGELCPPSKIESRQDTEDPSKLVFSENCETATPLFENCHEIAEKLGAPWPPLQIASSQMKYIALALGSCDVHLRVPRPKARSACVWDHAGGILICEEVGGKVTDVLGKKINLGTGRGLAENFGIIAAPSAIHPRILEAAKDVLSRFPEYEHLVSSAA